mmetsp:Transcript_7501/g.10641  ORF Transcript_7501/g.10641 Transcript_7501/m.10641 type:complete len:112 (-) Transcript_7501:193-528(-)
MKIQDQYGHNQTSIDGCEVDILRQNARVALQSSKQFFKSHPELSVKRCFEEIGLITWNGTYSAFFAAASSASGHHEHSRVHNAFILIRSSGQSVDWRGKERRAVDEATSAT